MITESKPVESPVDPAPPERANDTTPAPRPRRQIDPEARAKFVQFIQQNPLANRAQAGRRFGLDRAAVKTIVVGLRLAGLNLPKLAPGKPPSVETSVCWCGLPAVAGSSRCERHARLRPMGNRPRGGRSRDEEEPEVEPDGLHYLPTRYVPPVVDLERVKARDAERTRLALSVTVERLPPAPDLFRAAIERTQRWAEERHVAEAKANARARAQRHRRYELERARSRRQEALDRQDRIGEFAFDSDVSCVEDRLTAFREAMISSNGQRRGLSPVSFGLSEREAKLIIDRLIADGLITPRSDGKESPHGNEIYAPARNDV